MKNIVNLTPHTLAILVPGNTIYIEPEPVPARVEVTFEDGGVVSGIPVGYAKYGEIENLPEPKEGTIYVVSGMVESRALRKDVYSPGKLVRDSNGRPVGCEGLKQTIEGGYE